MDAEGEQDFDEDSLDDTPHTTDIEEDDTALNDTVVGTNEVVLTNDSIMGMNVKVLKEELKKRRLTISSNKRALQERLVVAVESGAPIGGPISVHPVRKSNKEAEDEIPKGFTPHAYWKVLDHESA